LNPHALRQQILSLQRLPIPPLPLVTGVIISQTNHAVNKSDIICAMNCGAIHSSAIHCRGFLEGHLGRVINPDGVGKERTQLMRSVVLALRELMQQNMIDRQTKDLAAYLAIALLAIDRTVEVSVTAWEKRDYWLKADRFRMEWSWAGRLGGKMRKAVLADDWAQVAQLSAAIAEKVKQTEVPKRHGFNAPWDGAYDRLQAQPNHNSQQ
jgi:hypothetical protein